VVAAPGCGVKCSGNAAASLAALTTAPVPETTISFTAELRKLKEQLSCAHHSEKFCYVNKINSKHEFQGIFKLTFWAKSIVDVSILFNSSWYSNFQSIAFGRC